MVLRPPPLSPPTAETFLKNQRRKLVYPWALGLGTQADGTGISSSVDTEGSKHYQLRTSQNFSSRQPSVGSRAGSPSPVTAPPFPACPIQALAGQRERAGSGPRGLRKKTKVTGVTHCHHGGAETAAAHHAHSPSAGQGWARVAAQLLCIKVGPGGTCGQWNVGGNGVGPSGLSCDYWGPSPHVLPFPGDPGGHSVHDIITVEGAWIPASLLRRGASLEETPNQQHLLGLHLGEKPALPGSSPWDLGLFVTAPHPS